jgi:hypothetical protein
LCGFCDFRILEMLIEVLPKQFELANKFVRTGPDRHSCAVISLGILLIDKSA